MKQTSLFGTDASTFSQADSLVSPTQSQVIDVGKRTSDISGRRCLERLEKLNHVGSLAKTFTVLLVGMTGWCSRRCKLTWKMKGTKSNRIYFQLQPSTLPIEEIEYGLLPTITASFGERGGMLNPESNHDTEKAFYKLHQKGLLPTPTASDIIGTPKRMDTIHQTSTGGYYRVSDTTGTKFGAKLNDVAQLLPTPATIQIDYKPKEGWEWMGNYWKDENGVKRQTDLATTVKMTMLPTPTKFDYNSARTPEKYEQDKVKYAEQGVNLQMPLKQMARNGMLPTPIAGDWKGQLRSDGTANMLSGKASLGMLPTPKSQEARGNASKDRGKFNLTDEVSKLHDHDGTSSQLNPLFVEEMMGFPENWTLLPFLNGETNPSKPTETPSSHK